MQKDGNSMFEGDGRFTLWNVVGTWKAIDPRMILIEFRTMEEIYLFNEDYTEAICVEPSMTPPMKLSIGLTKVEGETRVQDYLKNAQTIKQKVDDRRKNLIQEEDKVFKFHQVTKD